LRTFGYGRSLCRPESSRTTQCPNPCRQNNRCSRNQIKRPVKHTRARSPKPLRSLHGIRVVTFSMHRTILRMSLLPYLCMNTWCDFPDLETSLQLQYMSRITVKSAAVWHPVLVFRCPQSIGRARCTNRLPLIARLGCQPSSLLQIER
jgi:hypothetical protein